MIEPFRNKCVTCPPVPVQSFLLVTSLLILCYNKCDNGHRHLHYLPHPSIPCPEQTLVILVTFNHSFHSIQLSSDQNIQSHRLDFYRSLLSLVQPCTSFAHLELLSLLHHKADHMCFLGPHTPSLPHPLDFDALEAYRVVPFCHFVSFACCSSL